ncbi:5-formyltetrahydrofolate cyclo-ligase [Limibaculum sp. FT325]|uniref:5-formyltetrahydrofolate cyclo-ligase n=1 Tax=Thermohalobaculum sediminis TaxID=2939436 RepID=UPI0020C0C13C|nr:5-formyltetrahydrofolate cyclo-ligase [Limibaculum sediminis]MCL5778843.1 5-formyltetrahydrofolate cyclo-ligase [Limibaculum sediminis]
MTDDDPRDFASSPCMAHEFEPLSGPDLARWRKAERERLIALRLAVPAEARARAAEAVACRLDAEVEIGPDTIVSAYWPFRGELDLRGWLGRVIERGGRAALPVVVAKGQPLVFRDWHPGAPLERGVWNIPIPAESAEVAPNVVIAPLVGVDPQSYRLGYGGGFFDRTLAAMTGPRRVIGVGLDCANIPTIHPQPHDIPMDMVVTEPA